MIFMLTAVMKMFYHYLVQGRLGDQESTISNKSLYESQINNIQVFLFESPKKDVYRYVGRVCIISDSFKKIEIDIDGDYRNVIIFP